jgi:hypothetical protein
MSNEQSDKLSRVREHYNKVSDAAMSRMISGVRDEDADQTQRQLKQPSDETTPPIPDDTAAKRKPRG